MARRRFSVALNAYQAYRKSRATREGAMDEIDRRLLELLQEDATHSIAELAARVGLSSTPCWKRLQKLEGAGVISRRVALLDPERIGMGLTVFVAVEAYDHTPEWMEEFAALVAAMPEVMELYRITGDADYMLRVVVPDMAAYDGFYKRLIASAPLRNVTSRFAMECVKHTTAFPLDGLALRERRDAVGDAGPALRVNGRQPPALTLA
jgi:Lrp/AsnC family transcriptional regulator